MQKTVDPQIRPVKKKLPCVKRIQRIEYECDIHSDKFQGYNVSGGNYQADIKATLEKMNFGRFWCEPAYVDQTHHAANCRADNMND